MVFAANATQPLATERTLPIPAGYRQIRKQTVIVDGIDAELNRFERSDGRNTGIGGEHFSSIIAQDGRLKGLTRMELSLSEGQLPSREEARSIADAFLQKHAPDLLTNLELHWIEPHDESIRIFADGQHRTITLTGMKMKMRNSRDGLWFWVIVGTDRQVMVFERDIVWITMPGHRQREKWLHDSWLVEQGHAAYGA